MPGRRVYMDYSATTPVDPRVMEAMTPYFDDVFGNTSSIHSYGRKAESAVERARETVARVLNCQPTEVVFTGCGSESDNLAIRGAAWAVRQTTQKAHLITSPVEHPAVGKTITQLSEVMGFTRTLLPVDAHGQVDVEEFAQAIQPDTGFASVIYANNEIGTITPMAQLAETAKAHGVLFHTDAVQAAGQLPLDVQALGADMLSISGHKFYGPKGVGVLYVRDGIELIPSLSGGSHERGRRAGTLNTPLIVGLARALELAYDEREEYIAHFAALRDRLIDGILDRVPGARLTGHPSQRLPSHASFVIEGLDTNSLLMHLDMKGIAASGGSACKTGNPTPSDVLLAMGYTPDEALGGLRLTVGRHSSEEDVDYVVDALAEIVPRLHKLKQGALS